MWLGPASELEEKSSPKDKRRKPIDPWEVEIGRLTKSVDGKPPMVQVNETEATIQAGPRGPLLNKKDMAVVCGCEVEDRCWAVPLSMKKWPWNLEMCNHAGEKGHEHYDSDMHRSSKRDNEGLKDLIRDTLASQKLASGK